jgi:hypothetical protein
LTPLYRNAPHDWKSERLGKPAGVYLLATEKRMPEIAMKDLPQHQDFAVRLYDRNNWRLA